MSADLKDIKRLKVTEATNVWLKDQLREHPHLSKQEIIRNALHEMAVEAIRRANLLAGLALSEGISGDIRGRPRT